MSSVLALFVNSFSSILTNSCPLQSDGSEVPRAQVPSLTVSVISNEVTVPIAHDELPQFADEFIVHPEATTTRDGAGRGEGTGLTDVGQT